MENDQQYKLIKKSVELTKNSIVSLEVAQKLKGFGFSNLTLSYYLGIHLNHPGNWQRKNHNQLPSRYSAPTYSEVIDWLDEQGYFVEVVPEFYADGINWVWQVRWYKPKIEWLEDKLYHRDETKLGNINLPAEDYKLSFDERCMGGTGLHGDNHEYPTRPEAQSAAVIMALELYTGSRI